MADLNDVFRELDPPPGGRAKLTARLRHRERQRRAAWTLAVSAAAATLLFFARPAETPGVQWPADPTLMQLGLGAPPASGVTSLDPAHVAVQAVPTATPGVRFYRVDTLRIQ